MVQRLAVSARNAAANAVVDLIDAGAGAGTLKIYTGTQPTNPDTAATGTLLATVALIKPAFGNAATGTAAMADPAAVTGAAAGTAGWFRVADSTGAAVYDGAVTATGGGGEIELTTTTISVGVTVDLSGYNFTQPV